MTLKVNMKWEFPPCRFIIHGISEEKASNNWHHSLVDSSLHM